MSSYLTTLLVCIIYFLSSPAFAEVEITTPSDVPTSVHGVAGQITLTEVSMIADHFPEDEDEDSLIAYLQTSIHKQLQYLVGNLHGIEGGLELHNADIYDVYKVETIDDLVRYHYSVQIDAVITRSEAPIAEQDQGFSVILPERVDEDSIQQFFEKYSTDCSPNPHRMYIPEFYWYDFRPNAYYCPFNTQFSDATNDQKMINAIRVDMRFDVSSKDTQDTYPAYEAIWSDGKLVVTAVYALVGGLLGEQGQEGYEQVFRDLLRTYGPPIKINDDSLLEGRLDIDRPVVNATFETVHGPLEVHLFLINSLDSPSHVEGDELSDFVSQYNQVTQQSDLVIYNGHARHGSDNAKLDQLGTFTANHYQIFYVNTCASYTYGLPRVRQAYRDLNQETAYPDGYLDLVLNAMPAMGHEIAYMNLRYIHALVNAEESYQSILEDMYAKQQMLVLYDKDQQWMNELSMGHDKVDSIDESFDMNTVQLSTRQNQVHMKTQTINQGCSTAVPSNRTELWFAVLLGMIYFTRSKQRF